MSQRVFTVIVGLFAILTSVTSIAAQSGPTAVADGETGRILVDQSGMTLYRFTSDDPGVSKCNGACAGPWPPALVDAPTAAMLPMGRLGTMVRDDGGVGLTWEDMPLYLFARDTAPGDANGHGVEAFGGLWLVVNTDEPN